MSRKSRTKRARKILVRFLQEHPSRKAVTAEEFAGGRGPFRYREEPATPYDGPLLKVGDVSRVFSAFQAEGVLGSPYWPKGVMYDVAYPNMFRVLRIPEE